MKRILFLIAIVFFFYPYTALAQKKSTTKDTEKVLFENSKMKVTEYISSPGKDVCGRGRHSHGPHLDIAITDITGVEIGKDGKEVKFTEKAGGVYWNEAVTHLAFNKGSKPAILYIVEPK